MCEQARWHLHFKDRFDLTSYELCILWIEDLNVRAKTVKLLEQIIGQKLHDMGLGSDSVDVTPKTQAMTEKINRTSSKFKMFVHQRMQSTE